MPLLPFLQGVPKCAYTPATRERSDPTYTSRLPTCAPKGQGVPRGSLSMQVYNFLPCSNYFSISSQSRTTATIRGFPRRTCDPYSFSIGVYPVATSSMVPSSATSGLDEVLYHGAKDTARLASSGRAFEQFSVGTHTLTIQVDTYTTHKLTPSQVCKLST